MSNDRTSEFLSLAQSLVPEFANSNNSTIQQGRYHNINGGRYDSSSLLLAGGGGMTNQYNNNNTTAQKQIHDNDNLMLRNFHDTAKDISREIATTCAMLSELSQMVKTSRDALFSSSEQQMDVLVLRIKTHVEHLHSRLDRVEQELQQQQAHRNNAQARQQTINVVGQLKHEFVQATTGFKRVLQERTDVMRETSNRKRGVYGGDESSSSTTRLFLQSRPPVFENNHHQSLLEMNRSEHSTTSENAIPTIDLTSNMMMATGEPTGTLPRPYGASPTYGLKYRGNDDSLRNYSTTTGSYYYSADSKPPLTPLDIQRMEQESSSQQSMQLIPDQDYLQERANAMSTVESNILELGAIFNRLAAMVSEHQEMVQRIEDNTENASHNITSSLHALTDTLTSLQTNRALAMKLFGILVAFIIAFIIFFA